MSDFVHLHVHSEYALLDGLGKLDHLIERAKSFGMKALRCCFHYVDRLQ
ncbi:PHP domain-containing protein [Candidatus Gottesmanbacteria bacterium]|nr:PHP domain-containing protein [Candidatus Gottesmanbacteria bacterium]